MLSFQGSIAKKKQTTFIEATAASLVVTGIFLLSLEDFT